MSSQAETAIGVTTRARQKSWSPLRVLSATALASWAGLFWFLIATDRTSLYLSSRTAWVVPMGAIILSIATLGRIASARVEGPEPISRRGTLGLAVIILPVVTVLGLPPTSLDSFAASRRSSLTSGAFVSSAEDIASGELSLVDVSGATRSREAMHALQKRAGEQVSFTGFVTTDSTTPANEFVLTRFLISCCVADALTVHRHAVEGFVPFRGEADLLHGFGSTYP